MQGGFKSRLLTMVLLSLGSAIPVAARPITLERMGAGRAAAMTIAVMDSIEPHALPTAWW
jgi:hypothetical protein